MGIIADAAFTRSGLQKADSSHVPLTMDLLGYETPNILQGRS